MMHEVGLEKNFFSRKAASHELGQGDCSMDADCRSRINSRNHPPAIYRAGDRMFIGSALILLITWLTARWLGAKSLKDQLRVGVLWVALIVVFEFSLGSALGYTWERMLSDYNLAHGGLMGFGLLFMLFAPSLGAKLNQRRMR